MKDRHQSNLTAYAEPGFKVTYSKLINRYSVVSGLLKDDIIYIKSVELADSAVATVLFKYAKRDSLKYKAVVETVSESLQVFDTRL